MCDDVLTTCPGEDIKSSPPHDDIKSSSEFADIKEEDDDVADDDYDDPSFSDESMDDLDLSKTDEPTVTNTNSTTCSLPNKLNGKEVEHVVVRPVHTSLGIRLVPVSTEIAQEAFASNKTVAVPAKSEIIQKLFACQTCGDQFPSSRAMAGHARMHTKLECPICQKSFNRKDSLDIHIDRHAGKKPFKCDVCGKCFIRDSIRRKHVKQSHFSTPVEYRCEICGVTYMSKSGIFHHRLKHTGERPHKCDDCGKTFTAKTLLQMHVRVHTGEKPYKCGICDKRFGRENNLLEHSRVHTDERPYQCTMCPKRFKTCSHIIQHMAVHNKGKKESRTKTKD